MINNGVTNGRGKTIGFRCFECGDVVQSMWGTTCNRCRAEERRHKELLAVLKGKRK